jgi:hypothetical protein
VICIQSSRDGIDELGLVQARPPMCSDSSGKCDTN